MKKSSFTALIFGAALAVSFSPAHAFADELIHTITGTFSLVNTSPQDIGGLDGAEFSVVSVFDASQPYIAAPGTTGANVDDLQLLANSSSISISGASVPSSNGEFILPALGVRGNGEFFTQATEEFDFVLGGGEVLDFILLDIGSPDPDNRSLGDLPEVSDFANGLDVFFLGDPDFVLGAFSFLDGESSAVLVQTIPEPSSLALLFVVCGGLMARRRRNGILFHTV